MSHLRDERIRVLILIKGLGIGGAETLIADAAALWDTASIHYRVAYMLPWKDQLRPKIEGAGVEVVDLAWRGPGSLAAVGRFRRLCAEFDPQVIHSHLPAAGVLARLAWTPTAHVYTEHNIVDFYREPTKTLNRLTYGRNRVVIAVSEAVRESISGYPGPEPTVIPNGIRAMATTAEIEAVRSELGVDPGTSLVVHVGNIRPLKGHSNLIAATTRLVEIRQDVLVVSIGGEKNEGDLKRLRAETRRAGLEKRLLFLGRRPDARAFLAAADCVVSPSDVEGLPVVILEALALERPVVATDVGGVGTVIRDEVTGLLVSPGDPDALAAGVARCLDSPEAATWARNGRQLVEAEHGLRHMVDRYENIYRESVGE